MIWIMVALCALGLFWVGQGILMVLWGLWQVLAMLLRAAAGLPPEGED